MSHFKPGRLLITCIDAKNIRGRIDNSNETLRPYLRLRLDGIERAGRIGGLLGHDVTFDDEVVSFDLPQPKDIELAVELRDDGSGESVGTATFSVADVLTSGTDSTETLEVIKPGDTTTNSVVNLRFAFVQAKTGVIKLRVGGAEGATAGRGIRAEISTADGQSGTVALAEADGALGFWTDPTNWFGDFSICLYSGNVCIGEGKLSLLGCLSGDEIKNSTSHVPIRPEDGAQASVVTVDHWFLEAGFVKVESIRASNLRDASIDSTGLADPRIIVKAIGKTHATSLMTEAANHADSNEYRWNGNIRIPVVDEYTLQIVGCEYDAVSGEKEPIGSAEVSLLPLFKSGATVTSIDLAHENELGETLDGGQVHIALSFEPPRGAAFPRDQPTMTAYVLGEHDEVDIRSKKNMSTDDDDDAVFTDEAIQKAWRLVDLDKNGYIGVSELKHILIMMGEHVSDEEVDMMISMLDLNGDGQVSFKEFHAMAVSPDPANEDFLQGGLTTQTGESIDQRRSNEQAEQKREAFSRCVETCRMNISDMFRMWSVLRQEDRDEGFRIGYDGVCKLVPAAFRSSAECRMMFELLRQSDGDQTIDGRDLIMTFTNFVTGLGLEERCRLAFEMFDVDRSGYLSLDEIEAMMMSTNLTTRSLVKKRAENFMLCADTDR
ncbi:hypothetical protein ACHAWF_012013 [Thalassiosira exigua]